MAKAITTITIVQEGKAEPRHMTQEAQEAHIRNVKRIMRNIADGEITVTLEVEAE